MTNVELIFIPFPGLSHLVSTVESAKHLLDRDHRLSVTVLIMKLPTDKNADKYPESTPSPRLRFVDIPNQDFVVPPSSKMFIFEFINSRDTHVRRIISDLIEKPPAPNSRLAGLVLDMFCTKFAEVADEFNLPSYVFFTSGASALGMFNHLVSLKFERNEDLTRYKDSDAELSASCFSIPFPVKSLPLTFVSEGPMATDFLSNFKRLMGTKGVMVNTFRELEPFAIRSLLSDEKTPRVYPVGPILNLHSDKHHQMVDDGNKTWLDRQPEGSVVFLCFGTMGSFEPGQVKEIAAALENSGKRFLWSLRKPGEKGTIYPTEYEDYGGVLPEGFLERTEGIGRVTGWADQVGALSHAAVGGFVSHCGWNSMLESVWFGVPVATFPLYAEQQMNAFLLVKELGMAEAIRTDYQRDLIGGTPSEIVGAGEIEAAIRRLMEEGSGVRRKVKEMQRMSREALLEGGSSYNAQKDFIEDVVKNISG